MQGQVGSQDQPQQQAAVGNGANVGVGSVEQTGAATAATSTTNSTVWLHQDGSSANNFGRESRQPTFQTIDRNPVVLSIARAREQAASYRQPPVGSESSRNVAQASSWVKDKRPKKSSTVEDLKGYLAPNFIPFKQTHFPQTVTRAHQLGAHPYIAPTPPLQLPERSSNLYQHNIVSRPTMSSAFYSSSEQAAGQAQGQNVSANWALPPAADVLSSMDDNDIAEAAAACSAAFDDQPPTPSCLIHNRVTKAIARTKLQYTPASSAQSAQPKTGPIKVQKKNLYDLKPHSKPPLSNNLVFPLLRALYPSSVPPPTPATTSTGKDEHCRTYPYYHHPLKRTGESSKVPPIPLPAPPAPKNLQSTVSQPMVGPAVSQSNGQSNADYVPKTMENPQPAFSLLSSLSSSNLPPPPMTKHHSGLIFQLPESWNGKPVRFAYSGSSIVIENLSSSASSSVASSPSATTSSPLPTQAAAASSRFDPAQEQEQQQKSPFTFPQSSETDQTSASGTPPEVTNCSLLPNPLLAPSLATPPQSKDEISKGCQIPLIPSQYQAIYEKFVQSYFNFLSNQTSKFSTSGFFYVFLLSLSLLSGQSSRVAHGDTQLTDLCHNSLVYRL